MEAGENGSGLTCVTLARPSDFLFPLCPGIHLSRTQTSAGSSLSKSLQLCTNFDVIKLELKAFRAAWLSERSGIIP
jgi:hypothetical protein